MEIAKYFAPYEGFLGFLGDFIAKIWGEWEI